MGMVAAHLRYLTRRNLRPGTVEQRRRCLARLARRHPDLARVTTDELEEWLDGRALGAEARATEISHVRGFYRWCVETGRLEVSPAERLVRPKLARRLPRPMPDGNLAMAVEVAPEPVRQMLLLAAYAGLRACEIARLEGEHVLFDAGVLLVAEGKGGGMSSVPLSPLLVPELRRLPRSGPLFTLGDGRQMRPHNVSHKANRYLHDMGIPETLHQIRHWFGTKLFVASGRDLRATQEGMRHASPVSTSGYTWVDPGELSSSVARLPSLGQQERLPF
jgi:site-specific recombinase XerC